MGIYCIRKVGQGFFCGYLLDKESWPRAGFLIAVIYCIRKVGLSNCARDGRPKFGY